MALVTKHLFPFIRMINKLNIKHEIKEFYSSNKENVAGKTDEEKEAIKNEKGLELMFLLLEKLPNAEKEVFDFLALYTGKTVEDLQNEEISETMDHFETLMQEKAFTAFFQRAVK